MNELGELRPSQLIFTFGVGSLVDLPNMSAMVMGLDDWDTRYCKELEEDRLVAAVQKRLGPQMSKLYLPPIKLESADRDPAAPAIGVPVAPFPRWMRCSLCDTLSTVESGVFKLIQDPWRPDKTAYVHQGCLKSQGGKAPSAHSVRFLLACREGHLTDFPWLDFVHKGNVPCRPATLSMREFGASGDASDIVVKCHTCNAERRMADAFDPDTPFSCPGHHPHLRLVEHKCKENAKTILLGASNAWFPTALSALSIPRATDKLGKLVEEQWAELKDTEDVDEVRLLRKKLQRFQSLIPLFTEFKDEDIWAAIETKRAGAQQGTTPPEDLKLPEWQIFSNPDSAAESRDFKLKRVAPPKGFEPFFEDVLLVERIREVRALLGFTRVESNADFAEATVIVDGRLTKLSRESPKWLPASEVRGEGIFLRIREEVLLNWQAKTGGAAARAGVSRVAQSLAETQKAGSCARWISWHPAGVIALLVPCADASDCTRLRLHRSQCARAALLAEAWRRRWPYGWYPSLHRRAGQRRHSRWPRRAGYAPNPRSASPTSSRKHAHLRFRSSVFRTPPRYPRSWYPGSLLPRLPIFAGDIV